MSRFVSATTLSLACAAVVLGAPQAFASGTEAAVITPGRDPYPSGGTTVTGIGENSAGENAQLAETFPATFRSSWSAEPPLAPRAGNDGAVSIGVLAGRTVVVDRQYGAGYVSAYVTTTGELLWRRSVNLPGPALVVGTAVYVNSEDEERVDITQAIDIATGNVRWTSQGGVSNDDSLSAGDGLLVSGEKAMDLRTGETKFFLSSAATGGNSLVGDNRVFYNSDREIRANSVTTGALLWSFTKTDSSGAPLVGALQPVLHDGLLYLPSAAQNPGSRTFVLDPQTGKLITTLPPAPGGIAFDGTTAVVAAAADADDTESPILFTAVNVSTGHVYWSHSFGKDSDGFRYGASTPIIENGLVWATTALDDGHPMILDALSEVSGDEVSRTTLACPATSGSDLAFAEHRLAVPSLCGVLTYEYDQSASGPTTPTAPGTSASPQPKPVAALPRTRKPHVSVQPHTQHSRAGLHVRFVAKATGTPAPIVQWQMKRHGRWVNLRDQTHQRLAVLATRHRNGERLRARFRNASGVTCTHVARLWVRG